MLRRTPAIPSVRRRRHEASYVNQRSRHLAGWLILSGSILAQSVATAATHGVRSVAATNWNTSTDWPTGTSTNAVPNGNGEVAYSDITAFNVVTTLNVGGIVIGQLQKAGSRPWTINPTSGFTLTFNNSGGITNDFSSVSAPNSFAAITNSSTAVSNLVVNAPVVIAGGNSLVVGTTNNKGTPGTVNVAGGITSTGAANLYIASGLGAPAAATISIFAANTSVTSPLAVNVQGNLVVGQSDATNVTTGLGAITINGGIGTSVKTIQLSAAGTTTITGSISNQNGINANGTGVLSFTAVSNQAMLVNNGGAITIGNSNTFTIGGGASSSMTISNNGAITLTSSNLITVSAPLLTINNTGNLNINGTAAVTISAPGFTINNTGNITFNTVGTTTISGGGTIANTGNITIIGAGVVTANSGATLIKNGGDITLNGTASVYLGSGGSGLVIANSGNLVVNNAGVSNVASFGALVNNSGNISVVSSSNGATTFSGGIGTNVKDVTLSSMGNHSITGTVSNTGNVTVSPTSTSTTTTFTSLVNNTGQIFVNSNSTGTTNFSGGVGTNVTKLTLSATNGATTLTGTTPVSPTGDIIVNTSGVNNVATFTAPVNNLGIIVNKGNSTGTTTFSGSIGSNVSAIYQNNTATLTLSGTTSNTYTGLTTVNSGTLSLGKTTGAVAVSGNLLLHSGANVSFASTTDNIGDNSIVTIDGGGFNEGSAFTINAGVAAIQDTFAELHISGVSHYNNGTGFNIATATGVVVSGAATFLGSGDAIRPKAENYTNGLIAYFDAGGAFFAGSLSLKNMTNTIDPTDGFSNSSINTFTVVGTDTSHITTVTVGSGGLTLENSMLNLRRGSTSAKGSALTLNGNTVTTVGTGANGIVEDTKGGTVGYIGVNFSSTSTGEVTRTFNIGVNAPLTVGVPLANGSASKGTLTKIGEGTLDLTAANTFTGDFNVNAGLVRVNVTGALSTQRSINIANTGNLEVGALSTFSDIISDSALVSITNGGTLSYVPGSSTTNEHLGPLTLGNNAKIQFSNSDYQLFTFHNEAAYPILTGSNIKILGWTGTPYGNSYYDVDATDSDYSSGYNSRGDHVLFQIADFQTSPIFTNIQFYDDFGNPVGNAAKFVTSVTFGQGGADFNEIELVPIMIAVPEPSVFSTLLLAGAIGGLRRWRRREVHAAA